MSKILGSKADRDELTAALRDTAHVDSEEDPRYAASQERIRKAEAKLPPLGRAVARDRSL
ncbi:hypothetical protein [Nonomuraea turcica]|uniref:hypothetical protein n=1 Tax=Nonomuraea sp. G32 TaxID=3067274 RepID=UPI00273BE85F|nr:hypothetical protein [Nonomuraea sp. G32]MDP4501113.1 hypothetical protein [Nonomuraea sp. G32]